MFADIVDEEASEVEMNVEVADVVRSRWADD